MLVDLVFADFAVDFVDSYWDKPNHIGFSISETYESGSFKQNLC